LVEKSKTREYNLDPRGSGIQTDCNSESKIKSKYLRRTVVGKGTKTAKTPGNVHFVQINRKNYGFICFWALRVDLDCSLNRTNNPY